jgi:hypothetical protein
MAEPCPCAVCRDAPHCQRERLAYLAFSLYMSGSREPRWRPAIVGSDDYHHRESDATQQQLDRICLFCRSPRTRITRNGQHQSMMKSAHLGECCNRAKGLTRALAIPVRVR